MIMPQTILLIHKIAYIKNQEQNSMRKKKIEI